MYNNHMMQEMDDVTKCILCKQILQRHGFNGICNVCYQKMMKGQKILEKTNN